MRTNFDPIVRTRPAKSSYAPGKRADRKRSAAAKRETLSRKDARVNKYVVTLSNTKG